MVRSTECGTRQRQTRCVAYDYEDRLGVYPRHRETDQRRCFTGFTCSRPRRPENYRTLRPVHFCEGGHRVGVLREGLIAASLTALMILLFLGSWRSTLIIAVSSARREAVSGPAEEGDEPQSLHERW